MKLIYTPVNIHWSFLILILSIIYQSDNILEGVYIGLVLSFCIIIHEMGHALAAEYLGHETRSITLFLLGGATDISYKKLKQDDVAIISAAGPLANFLMAIIGITINIIFAKFKMNWQIASFYIPIFWGINLISGLFNLIPVYPLDGGRLFKYYLGRVASHDIVSGGLGYSNFVFGLIMIAAGLYWLNPFLVISGFYIFRIS